MSQKEETFNKISTSIEKIVDYVVIIAFILLVISCVTQVFTRYVLNNSLPWTEELARYSFMYVNILGAVICVRRKTNARVTAILEAVGVKAGL